MVNIQLMDSRSENGPEAARFHRQIFRNNCDGQAKKKMKLT